MTHEEDFLKIRSSHRRCSEFMKKTLSKETPTQVFTCEYCEIFKNKYFEKHLRTTASRRFLHNKKASITFNIFVKNSYQAYSNLFTKSLNEWKANKKNVTGPPPFKLNKSISFVHIKQSRKSSNQKPLKRPYLRNPLTLHQN